MIWGAQRSQGVGAHENHRNQIRDRPRISQGQNEMKILYINVIEENVGWGAECFVNRGFLRDGHESITLDYRKNRYHLAKHFLSIEKDIDVLFLQRGDGFPLELLEAVNRPRIFWASELVARNRDQDRLLRSGLFDHIFVRTHTCKNVLVKKGWVSAENVSILLSGFDEVVQYPMPLACKDIDVLFVGSVTPRRRIWLDHLKKEFRIVEANAFGTEMTTLLNRGKIILNIHAEDFIDTETRVFEALGCRSFLITEKLSKENPFISEAHLVETDDLSQMAEKIDYYLRNDDERDKIAACGHQEALVKHTYTKRAEEIVNLFSKYIKPSSQPPIHIRKVKAYAKKELIIKNSQRLKQAFSGALKRIVP